MRPQKCCIYRDTKGVHTVDTDSGGPRGAASRAVAEAAWRDFTCPRPVALGLFLQLYLEGPQDDGEAEQIAEAIRGQVRFSAHRRHQPEFLTQWYGVRLKNAQGNKFPSGSGVGSWLFGLLS